MGRGCTTDSLHVLQSRALRPCSTNCQLHRQQQGLAGHRAPTTTVGSEHRPIQSGAELRFPPFAHRAFGCLGDRRRGRSVENARPPRPVSGWGRHPDCGGSRRDRRSPHSTSGRASPGCRGPGDQSGRNIAPFKPGRSCVSPPFAHRAFGCLGSCAVDEAWKTHDRCRLGSGRGRHRDCGGSRRDRTVRFIQLRSGRCRGAGDRGPSLDGTWPHSNRGRVAFPTLRPPRLWLFGGPAPWTKRGKRTTAVALVGVGSAAGPRIENIIRSRPRTTRKPTPS